jgi:protein TonB
MTRIHFIVDTQGMPQQVRVVKSAADGANPKQRDGLQALDAKAVEAVEKYQFKPATRDGQPVAVELNVEVNFQIF